MTLPPRPRSFAFLGMLAFVLSPLIRAEAGGISARATIAGLAGPNSQSSSAPVAAVSAVAVSGASRAEAAASTDLEFKTYAHSEALGTIFPGTASAGMLKSFSIKGLGSGQRVPLSFDFEVTGTVSASTGAVGTATATLSGLVGTVGAERRFFEQIQVHNGLPSSFTTSLDNVRGNIAVSVTPSGQNSLLLSAANLVSLGLSPDFFSRPAAEFEVSAFQGAAASIVQNIFANGFAPLNLLPGTEVDVSMDTAFTYSSKFSLSGNFLKTSSLEVNLVSDATAGGIGAVATSDFSHTLRLKSITVPSDYNEIDPSTLSVSFENGVSFPVTRASAVPEPSTLSGLVLAVAVWILARRKRS